jgi:hypothetical protein
MNYKLMNKENSKITCRLLVPAYHFFLFLRNYFPLVFVMLLKFDRF